MSYSEIRKIDVSKYVDKKGKFSYLSWSWAVDQLLLLDPTATWEYKDPTYFHDNTMMVYCAVTAFGKTMQAQLPVMDNYNKPIIEPNAMQVNTAMQRCLAKAIALHGLGLYIYQGEDLPDLDGSDLVAMISSANTLKELQDVFTNLYKANSNNESLLKELTKAKDERKTQLQGAQS